MFLTVLVHVQSLRWIVPTAIILGSSPISISLWGSLRILTSFLPSRFYTYGDEKLYSLYQRLILAFFHTFTGVKIQLYGDSNALFKQKENVIFICNHQCTVDWLVVDMLAAPQGSIGSLRYILKDGLRFFPLYGFYFRQHSCVYVQRDRKFNQGKAERQVAELKDQKLPVWLVIFPEGTRFNPDNPDVIARSKQFSRDNGFPELQNVLAPKVKAVHVGVEQLRGHVTAVYDVTIAYSNTLTPSGERTSAPGMIEFLNGASPEIHVHFERVPLDDLPVDGDTAGTAKWLFSRFLHKDRLMSDFYSHKPTDSSQDCRRFPGESRTLQIGPHQTLPALLFYGSCLALLLGTSQGRQLYWKIGVFGSIAGCLWMSVRF